MFLKGFKEKSNQKFINKLIDSRKAGLSSKKIESVGILVNLSEFDDFETLRIFYESLKINPNKIKIVGFTEDKDLVESSIELLYSEKQIGWKGKIKNNELISFINTNFDVLVSFYKKDNLELNLVTALSKANFKVGLSNYDERLHDLILDVYTNNFEVFKNEFIKYLTILKKL
ncbi:MAG: hypothetical protein HKO81_03865 [Flavobacteriaceae bacterium]|nr:hypothetical protein [Bacteroidia bacterium]NNL15762.1 hypothetical protein [Flavobacteriaceae bacterium]